MDSTDQLIKERGATYGNFTDVARVAQGLKNFVRKELRGSVLPDCQQEALEFIMTKIARLICGQSNHEDTWQDIAGYARLVVDRLPKKPAAVKDRECIELSPCPRDTAILGGWGKTSA